MRVLAISGGVGGAKLCEGLAAELNADELAVVVNTADDFRLFGLHISPDIDTLLYTLAGLASRDRGWGLSGETWNALDAMERLGGDSWFRLGDKDLATHLFRSERLAQGSSLSEVTDLLRRRLAINSLIVPMSDETVATIVHSEEGALPFQEYFVKRRCEPRVKSFEFTGIEQARPSSQLLSSLEEDPPELIVICPSNPFVSVDPVLQVPGMLPALKACSAPVLAVSPIVSGMAIKGPAAKMMAELGIPVSAPAVLEHYRERYPGLLDSFIIDESDATLGAEIDTSDVELAVRPTIMRTLADKRALARDCLELLH